MLMEVFPNILVAGVNDETKDALVQCSDMELKALPVRYLSVHLISTRLKMRDCEEIKRKILVRSQSWTARALSYAGSFGFTQYSSILVQHFRTSKTGFEGSKYGAEKIPLV